MLIDKNEVMYHIDQALASDPVNEQLKILKKKVTSIRAAVLFTCNGEACETEFRACKLLGPDACTHTARVEYAKNFEPITDRSGRCYGFSEKEERDGQANI